MPYKSKAQQRWMFAAEDRGEVPEGTALRWAHHTKSIKKLPEHVGEEKKGFSMHNISFLAKQAAGIADAVPPPGAMPGLENGGGGGGLADILRASLGAGGVGAGLGAMAGTPMGGIAGATRGNVSEGLGRGMLRGGMTGAGAGLGALAGGLLTGGTGHGDLGSLAGAGLGGLAGYVGGGKLLGKPSGAGKEDDVEKSGAFSLGARAAEQSYVEKLASDMQSDGRYVYRLAEMVKMPVVPFVKQAYADTNEFIRFLKVANAVERGEIKREGLRKAARFIRKGSLLEKFAFPGGGMMAGAKKMVGKGTQAVKDFAGTTAGKATAIGTGVTAAGGGAAILAGKGGQTAPPAPAPAAPGASQAPPEAPGASQGPQTAPQAAGPQETGAVHPAIKACLAAGGIGAGALGLGAIIRAFRKKKDPNKQASDMDLAKDVMCRAIIKKAHAIARQHSAEILCKHLDVVAGQMSLVKSASVRILQREVAAGKDLSVAIKMAYPQLPGEQRGILATKLCKAAFDWYHKQAGAVSSALDGAAHLGSAALGAAPTIGGIGGAIGAPQGGKIEGAARGFGKGFGATAGGGAGAMAGGVGLPVLLKLLSRKIPGLGKLPIGGTASAGAIGGGAAGAYGGYKGMSSMMGKPSWETPPPAPPKTAAAKKANMGCSPATGTVQTTSPQSFTGTPAQGLDFMRG